MKITQNKFIPNFKGIMQVRLSSERNNYTKYIETTENDDYYFNSKIPNNCQIDDNIDLLEYNKKAFEISNIIKNICKRNNIFLPKIDECYDDPVISRQNYKVSYFAGSEAGRYWEKSTEFEYDWKLLDVEIDLRDTEQIKIDIKNKINKIKQLSEIETSIKSYIKITEQKLQDNNLDNKELVATDNHLNVLYENTKAKEDLPF